MTTPKITETPADAVINQETLYCGFCLAEENKLHKVYPIYYEQNGFHYRLFNRYYCPYCREIRHRDKKELYTRAIAQDILKR